MSVHEAQAAVGCRRDPGYAGRTTWNYRRLGNLAIDGITPLPVAPLKIATYLLPLARFTSPVTFS